MEASNFPVPLDSFLLERRAPGWRVSTFRHTPGTALTPPSSEMAWPEHAGVVCSRLSKLDAFSVPHAAGVHVKGQKLLPPGPAVPSQSKIENSIILSSIRPIINRQTRIWVAVEAGEIRGSG
jgi:hypothetical protein